MTRQSLSAFRRTVTVNWPKGQETDARRFLVRVAKRGHQRILREQTGRAGVTPEFEAFANRPGRPVDAVTLPGPIVYRYSYLREAVLATLAVLRANSPHRSGAYEASHTLYVNGVAQRTIPQSFSPGDDIMIANPVPYARRLEIGRTKSGRSFVVQVPNRIYERSMKDVRRRYRNVAAFSFSYATLPQAHTIRGSLGGGYGIAGGRSRARQQKRNIGQPVKSPAIVIRAL